MDFEEFKYLINRITLLSDKCAGLKTQNTVLQQRLAKAKDKNHKLNFQNQQLAEKVTELNHKLQKCITENDALRGIDEEKCMTPGEFHGRINITEKR